VSTGSVLRPVAALDDLREGFLELPQPVATLAARPTVSGDLLNNAVNVTVGLRRAAPGDREPLRRFLAGLSQLSNLQRFFTGAARTRERDLDVLLRADRTGYAVIATSGPGIVGHAMWAPVTGAPGTGEVGVVVAERHQRQGIGTALLRAVVADAHRAGVHTLEAFVLAGNEVMHRLIRDLVPHIAAEHDDDLVRYRMALDECSTRAA
jgi:RimJ/RimL family protein N-acetyltransferase